MQGALSRQASGERRGRQLRSFERAGVENLSCLFGRLRRLVDLVVEGPSLCTVEQFARGVCVPRVMCGLFNEVEQDPA